ncbi:MAG: hypothetical protein ACFWUE_01820 [Xylanivirga thermophila]|uniref:hypothetical protein n=1 Tax=Xylanivirga thermophila TaxID=2496273 RepID=UPI0039F4DA24
MKNIKDIYEILSADIFKLLINNNTVQITQLNAAITLLIKNGIPFDVVFTPGTRRTEPQAELTIYINPNTTITFTMGFGSGTFMFSPSDIPGFEQ